MPCIILVSLLVVGVRRAQCQRRSSLMSIYCTSTKPPWSTFVSLHTFSSYVCTCISLYLPRFCLPVPYPPLLMRTPLHVCGQLSRVSLNAITTCDGSGATGLGLFLSAAMFNHGCRPNCQAWWKGSKVRSPSLATAQVWFPLHGSFSCFCRKSHSPSLVGICLAFSAWRSRDTGVDGVACLICI